MAEEGGAARDQLSMEHYPAIVVGTGFGGAVAACRLAQAGIAVAVLERGRRFPPGSFPRDMTRPASGWLWNMGQGLYDLKAWEEMLCIVAAGYGGGPVGPGPPPS